MKEIANILHFIAGVLICFALMKSCNKPSDVIEVDNTDMQKKLDSLQGVIGIVHLEREESVKREQKYIHLIKGYEKQIQDIYSRTFTDLQRDEWIRRYRAKPDKNP